MNRCVETAEPFQAVLSARPLATQRSAFNGRSLAWEQAESPIWWISKALSTLHHRLNPFRRRTGIP